MFKNLTNFGFKRTAKQAFGFYLAYFLLLVITAFLSGSIVGLILGENENAFDIGRKIGNIIAVITTLILSFLVLKEKKLLSNFGYILLALLSGLIALFTGALGGLIPVAYMTTRRKQEKEKEKE